MVALRPEEWNPICSSASSTVTGAWLESAAAADRPAMPPPMSRMSGLFTPSSGGEPLVHDLAAFSKADSFDDLIVGREHRPALFLVPEGTEEIVEVPGKKGGRVRSQSPSEVRGADDRYPVLFDILTPDGPFDVAAGVSRKIDDHAARPHRRDLCVADEPRRGLTRNQGCRDYDVLLGNVAGDEFGLRLLILPRPLGRVAAGSLSFDPSHVLDENGLSAERLDLLLRRRPDVGRTDLRTETFRSGDRLQPSDSHAHHEHLGGTDRPGGRHHHREGASICRRGVYDGLVAGKVGLGRENVHGLGTGDSGHPLHRQRLKIGTRIAIDPLTLAQRV